MYIGSSEGFLPAIMSSTLKAILLKNCSVFVSGWLVAKMPRSTSRIPKAEKEGNFLAFIWLVTTCAIVALILSV